MVTAMTSLLTSRPVRHEVGMTGEITLRGRVLPVGGVKMKVLAAHRAGLTTVILPKRNEHDLDELPEDVRQAHHLRASRDDPRGAEHGLTACRRARLALIRGCVGDQACCLVHPRPCTFTRLVSVRGQIAHVLSHTDNLSGIA